MNSLKNKLAHLRSEESGQSLIEYSLIAGIVAVGAMAILFSIRGEIVNLFTAISNSLRSAM